MYFPHRIYGIENEFGVVVQYPDGTLTNLFCLYPDSGTHRFLDLKEIENSVLCFQPNSDLYRVWHSNGGCTYVDTGEHPEHATPECLSVHDAVRYNKAGELLASRMFDRKKPDDIRFLLFKNNIGCDMLGEETNISGNFGCHENYFIPGVFKNGPGQFERFKQLIPFLATRQIFDGSGWWDKDGHFDLSQRASSIYQEFSFSATSNRPFIQIKHGDSGSDLRLHIVAGDANICEFALYLKLGTTALVLALLESGNCPDIMCTNPVEALQAISHHGDAQLRSLQMQNGSAMSACEVQELFFEAIRAQLPDAQYADEHVEQEVKQIVRYWEQTLHAISNRDVKWMRGRIDHVTKRYLAQQQIARARPTSPSETLLLQKNIDILYHGVSNRTLQQRMNAHWPDCRIVTDDEIADACINPPANTRARMRGKFVQALIAHHISPTKFISWSCCTLADQPKDRHFYFPSVFHSDVAGFEAFLSSIMPMHKS